MSCLILSDMSLSDQIAVEVSHANNRTITIEEEMAKLERMIDNHYAPKRNYAARNISTPATPTDCPEALPSERGVAGNSIKEFV
jgi:hypothetical protein